MRKNNILKKVAMMLSFVLLMAGCGGGSGTEGKEGQTIDGKDPVKIGVILPMTGVAALYGEQANNGVELAVKQINESGGILDGRPVEICLEDDKANPEEGVNAVKKLMTRDDVKFITGGVNSSVVLAEVQATKDAGMLQVVTVAKAPAIREQGHPYLFALNTTNKMDDAMFHKYIAETIKPKKVAILVENTDYGHAEMDEIKNNWGSSGPKVVATDYFQLGENDFTVQLNKLKATQPDVLYITVASPSTNGAILKQAYEIDFDTIKIIAPGNLNTDVIKLAAQGAEELLCADIYVNTVDNPINKEFVKQYQSLKGTPPEKMELLGYESIYVLAKAIDKAGTDTDIAKVAETLRSNTWETPRGQLAFNEQGQAQGEAQVQVVKDGKITLK